MAEDRLSASAAYVLLDEVVRKASGHTPEIALAQGAAHHDSQGYPPYLKVSSIVREARDRGLPVTGPMLGGGRLGFRPHVRAAALVATKVGAGVVLFLVDDDRENRGEDVTSQSGAESNEHLLVVAGVPIPETEAWFLVALGEDERESLRRELTFDPVAQPNRLTSTSGRYERDAKTIFARVFGSQEEALDRLRAAGLSHLKRHGAASGLSAFILALEEEAAPLWREVDGEH